MNKLLLFRIAVISFIVLNFIVSFRLDSEAACLIGFFNFLFSLAYLVAEIIIARETAESKS